MTARTFAASLSHSTTALGEAVSRDPAIAPSAVGESRGLIQQTSNLGGGGVDSDTRQHGHDHEGFPRCAHAGQPASTQRSNRPDSGHVGRRETEPVQFRPATNFLILGVLTAWGERVANGTMSPAAYAAKVRALAARTADA